MGVLGSLLTGLVKGSWFFVNHGGADSFYAGVNKVSQAASATLRSAVEESKNKMKEQNESN